MCTELMNKWKNEYLNASSLKLFLIWDSNNEWNSEIHGNSIFVSYRSQLLSFRISLVGFI